MTFFSFIISERRVCILASCPLTWKNLSLLCSRSHELNKHLIPYIKSVNCLGGSTYMNLRYKDWKSKTQKQQMWEHRGKRDYWPTVYFLTLLVTKQIFFQICTLRFTCFLFLFLFIYWEKGVLFKNNDITLGYIFSFIKGNSSWCKIFFRGTEVGGWWALGKAHDLPRRTDATRKPQSLSKNLALLSI